MTQITGAEKHWWHDDQGRHRMADLRHTDYPERFWDSDERAYHAHLDHHDQLAAIPQPEESDSDSIKALFEMAATADKVAASARALIVRLRQKEC